MLIATRKQLLLEVKQLKLWARIQLYDTTKGIAELHFGDRIFNFLGIELTKLNKYRRWSFFPQVESHLTKGLQCDILIC